MNLVQLPPRTFPPNNIQSNIVYMPEDCIGQNIYHKSIAFKRDVKEAELKEVPFEVTFNLFAFGIPIRIDDMYDQEIVEKWIADSAKSSSNPEQDRRDVQAILEKTKKLMREQYIKENYPRFEYHAFLEGKVDIFYVNDVPLNKEDSKVGVVATCSWYRPIRAVRFPDCVSTSYLQHAGDHGYCYTTLNINSATIHEGIYYFF